MEAPELERRLAAIVAADVEGYSRHMHRDEETTMSTLSARRSTVDCLIAGHRGRIANTAGDSLLAEFASVLDAVSCAVAIQRAMEQANAAEGAQLMRFRIGINVGDVMVKDGDIFGDGVNVAARLEALAEPGGICVSARVQEDAAGRLDLVFEDLGEQSLKNIARAVRVYRVNLNSPHPNPPPQVGEGIPAAAISDSPLPRLRGRVGVGAADPPALALPDKPSIAVLPFQNMSGDPEQEYFADGMVEEIITALSRIRWLFVIARNSTFTYKGQAVDVKQVGRELGVRYVLEGSVRKGGNRVRITGQLIDAETGTHLWADRFDGSLEDVFDLQDKVASSVAGVIEPALQAAETARSTNRPTDDLTAYDLYLRANAMVRVSARRIPEALRLLEQAIERDPRYGPALAYAALCCFRLHEDGASEDPEADRQKGIGLSRRALEAASDDPGVLTNAALALVYFGEDIGAMMALVERALTLNPNFARGWFISGVLRKWAGQPDLSVEHCKASMRLSPRASVGSCLAVIGMAHFLAGRFEEALPNLRLAIQEDPSFLRPYYYLTACYAHMGRLGEAREIVEQLRAITREVVPDVSYLRDPEHRELFLSGLRLTMGEAA